MWPGRRAHPVAVEREAAWLVGGQEAALPCRRDRLATSWTFNTSIESRESFDIMALYLTRNVGTQVAMLFEEGFGVMGSVTLKATMRG